jgi:hypothetical protein
MKISSKTKIAASLMLGTMVLHRPGRCAGLCGTRPAATASKARLGTALQVTGPSAPYERPECLDIALMTGEFPVEACVETLPNHTTGSWPCWFVMRRGVGHAPFTFRGGSKWT